MGGEETNKEAKPEKKKDGGWYYDSNNKAQFLDGIKFPNQFDDLHIKGRFFGVVQGEYNADGTHTVPHYTTYKNAVPKAHHTAKPTTPPR